MSHAECGRHRAIELAERVRPILDTLYQDWRLENPPSKSFEFAAERDASMRLLSRIASSQEINEMLGRQDGLPNLSAASFHPLVWNAASAQWSTGHFHEAVLAAAKAVNSMLQTKVARRDVSEASLVREAFSSSEPVGSKPRLRYPSITDTQTRDSFTQGTMHFGQGLLPGHSQPRRSPSERGG